MRNKNIIAIVLDTVYAARLFGIQNNAPKGDERFRRSHPFLYKIRKVKNNE